MQRGEIAATSLAELTLEEIDYILELAMDTDDWHTPVVSDIKIHTQHDKAVYGYCNLSLHNTFHNAEHWFNINSTSIKIWKERYVRGRANKSHYRPIYNIQELAIILNKVAYKEPSNPL
jgi:hypothetical protein